MARSGGGASDAAASGPTQRASLVLAVATWISICRIRSSISATADLEAKTSACGPRPPRPGTLREWSYTDRELRLARGAEMGRFLLGSTVVMLFPKDTLAFNTEWSPTRAIRMGEAMGSRAA